MIWIHFQRDVVFSHVGTGLTKGYLCCSLNYREAIQTPTIPSSPWKRTAMPCFSFSLVDLETISQLLLNMESVGGPQKYFKHQDALTLFQCVWFLIFFFFKLIFSFCEMNDFGVFLVWHHALMSKIQKCRRWSRTYQSVMDWLVNHWFIIELIIPIRKFHIFTLFLLHQKKFAQQKHNKKYAISHHENRGRFIQGF